VAIATLAAAFALAALLTLAAMLRRVREFGTLKALGWRASRITTQVLTESAAIGVVGALAGLGLRNTGRRTRTAKALDTAGFADWAAHLPAEISGGQQWAAIVRALVKEPAVFPAYEPTGTRTRIPTTGLQGICLTAESGTKSSPTPLQDYILK
jgi:predicted lysophospholipase L1 biosynthesis ABC-type transport system permease subunit